MGRKISEMEVHIKRTKKVYSVKIGCTVKYNLTYDQVLDEIAKEMNHLVSGGE